ncbi:MAG: hypothetical protein ACYC6W_12480 [Nitrosotalea sp.]
MPCSIISALGLVASYIFFQFKTNHAVIGGIFGIVMMISFGTWLVGEIAESFLVLGVENNETMEYVNSILMVGFGIFLIVRFFWLRSIMPIESKYLRSGNS